MSASRSANRQTRFFRDLASPISAPRSASTSTPASRFATPGQAAAVSALWRDNFPHDSPPPPPIFSLDDRPDFSPEPLLPPHSPSSHSPRSPSVSPFKPPSSAAAAAADVATAGTEDWWSPVRGRAEGKGDGSPVSGVIKEVGAGALVILPPPREVARPEVERNGVVAGCALTEEEWVKVYGFSPADTNLVLREFEKCGVILKHVPGPREANWMHILYQNRFDARKALRKDGLQINSVLVIGVKPVDPGEVQFLDDRIGSNHAGGFMVSLPPKPFTVRNSEALTSQGVFPRPNYLHTSSSPSVTSGDAGHRPTGAIASPAKSVVSKVMDLMFGI